MGESRSNGVTESAEAQARAEKLTALWNDILGADSDVQTGFIANGGDSLKAVLLADQIFELTGHEVDYLEILNAPDFATLARAVGAGGRD